MAVAGGLGATAGAGAALANFVSPPMAAGLGGSASVLAMCGDAWVQRRQGKTQANETWQSSVLNGPATFNDSGLSSHTNSVLHALNPDERVVPFSPLRGPYLLSIVDWCRRLDGKRMWQVTGGAGSGKTRLLIEVAEHLADKNYECGWVRHGQAIPAAKAALTRPGRVLLIVDDVDASPRQQHDLAGMLSILASTPRNQVKVIFCGREFASWWANIRADMDPTDQAAFTPAGRTILTPALASMADQPQQFRGAVKHYARHFDRPVPTASLPSNATITSLAELHAAAAITAYNGLTGPIDVTTALRELFTAEEAWWLSNAAEQQPPIGQPLPVLQSAITAATLIGADSMAQAARRLAQLPGLTASSYERRMELALWLRQLYAQRNGRWLDPHLPAHLVDRYAALCATAQPGLPEALAVTALIS